MPDLAPVDHRVASAREARECREARERLEAQRASEEYMAELRRRYLEHAEEEDQRFAQ